MNNNVYNIGDRRQHPRSDRPLSETLNEAKSEFKAFVETRVAMFRSEMREKVAHVKTAAPLLVMGALFAATAWFVLTAALAFLITVAFQPSPYASFIAWLIVGVFDALVGACALWIGYRRLTAESLIPERTITVLKEDKVWLQNEARTQL